MIHAKAISLGGKPSPIKMVGAVCLPLGIGRDDDSSTSAIMEALRML